MAASELRRAPGVVKPQDKGPRKALEPKPDRPILRGSACKMRAGVGMDFQNGSSFVLQPCLWQTQARLSLEQRCWIDLRNRYVSVTGRTARTYSRACRDRTVIWDTQNSLVKTKGHYCSKLSVCDRIRSPRSPALRTLSTLAPPGAFAAISRS